MKRITTGFSLLVFCLGLVLAQTPQQEERFSVAGLKDHEVEKFYKEFREAVAAGDKQKVASLVSFPITATLASGKRQTIRTRVAFVKSYDLIFDDKFRALIAKTEFADLWAKFSGVATPRGEIWIGGIVKSKTNFDDYVIKIIAINGVFPEAPKNEHATPAQRITLLNHNPKVDNWNEAVVSFRIERLYNRVQGPHNEWDVLYGGLTYNGNGDWLRVNCDNNSWSRIRDLGKKDWSDDIDVPVLRILPCLNDQCGRIQIPPPHSGSKIEDENLNPHIAKAEVGHMYVVHRFREKRRREDRVFQSRSDYYTLIRIEELKPNESCTITWKRVATPDR